MIIRKLIYYFFYFKLKKIEKLKNKHYDESVYLIADGAEIKFYDLKLLDDNPVFCFNQSFLHTDIQTRTNITYGLLVEPFFFNKAKFINRKKLSYINKTRKYVKRKNLIFFSSLTNLLSLSGKFIYNIFLKLPNDPITRKLIGDGIKFNEGGFSTSLAIIKYLGFNKVYIFGVSLHDHSFSNHWYELGLGDFISNHKDPPEGTVKTINLLEQAGLELIMVTPTESSSNYFKTITYNKLFNKNIMYRENSELLDKKYLKMLKRTGRYYI